MLDLPVDVYDHVVVALGNKPFNLVSLLDILIKVLFVGVVQILIVTDLEDLRVWIDVVDHLFVPLS